MNDLMTTEGHEIALPSTNAAELAQQTAWYDHCARVADTLAISGMVPQSLTHEGPASNPKPLPPEVVRARCFLVTAQAVRWGMDPLAVIGSCAFVHNKLCYEGKLVAAVLNKHGVWLHYAFTGDAGTMSRRIFTSDHPLEPDDLVPGHRPSGVRVFDGSVEELRTTGNGSPWAPKNFDRMLIYRSTRDWCRFYQPALLLGVHTDDEVEAQENVRSERARPIGGGRERARQIGQRSASEGFQEGHAEAEIAAAAEPSKAKAEPKRPPSKGKGAAATADSKEPAAAAEEAAAADPDAFPGDTPAVSDPPAKGERVPLAAVALPIVQALWAAADGYETQKHVDDVVRPFGDAIKTLAADSPDAAAHVERAIKAVRAMVAKDKTFEEAQAVVEDAYEALA